MAYTTTHIAALSEIAASGQPFVVVTMVDAKGSTPQDAGAKMIVDQNGLVHGTVGGGKVESRAIEFACEMLKDPSRKREIVDWNLQRDIGMTCGGLVQLFFEVFNRDDWSVVVFGAGHVAQALVRVLVMLDCRVSCIDTRSDWIDKIPDHPRLRKICAEDLTVEADKLQPTDYVICMTMGHSTDRPILSAIFKKGLELPYLGVIGSRSKRGALLRELKSDGIPADAAEGFLCPIGMSIGTNQPAEIAISIVAQLIERRDATVEAD